MRRRLERDRNRVHDYHDDLRRVSLKRLAALGGVTGERAESDRRRETLRVAAVEREYRAKLDGLFAVFITGPHFRCTVSPRLHMRKRLCHLSHHRAPCSTLIWNS